jgi:hypothetical protein
VSDENTLLIRHDKVVTATQDTFALGGVNLNDITINYGLRSRILAVAFASVGGYAPQDVAKAQRKPDTHHYN